MTINLHAHPSDLRYASRLLKETRSLAGAGLVERIHIVGIWDQGLPEYEDLDEKRTIWRVRLRFTRGRSGLLTKILRHAEWQIRILSRYLAKSVAIVNCHSLATLPLGVALKAASGSAVVYDTHELETETASMVGIRKVLAKMLERLLVKRTAAVITVNKSIAAWYKARYRLANVHVVRNVPYRPKPGATVPYRLKEALGLHEDQMLFIYQGGLTEDRGLDLLLDTFASLDRRKHIVFMGYGPLTDLVKGYERRHANIHFHPAVSPQALPAYTAGADVGLCMYQNVCLNQYLCLPNKVFEYLIYGLPIVVSDLPEMGRLVDESGGGWKVAVDGDALCALLSAISWDEVRAKRERVLEYRNTLGWEEEEPALLAAYRGLGLRARH